MKNRKVQPVIVIGMHRSGTSLVSQMLDQAGVFIGADLDIHHESLFFMDMNRWLLAQSGGRWDTPASIDYLVSNNEVFNIFKTHISNLLQSEYICEYLGKKYYKHYKSLFEIDFPWGWKDPRSTVTLPIWLSIFPNAKIIHVCRHGVDVAASLRARERKSILERQRNYYDALRKKDQVLKKTIRELAYDPYSKSLYDFNRKMPPRPNESLRCLSLKQAFGLWKEYTQTAFDLEKTHKGQLFSIKYEILLGSPEKSMQQILHFLGLSSSEPLLNKLSVSVDPSRAYAYMNDPELVEFEKTVSSTLNKYGY